MPIDVSIQICTYGRVDMALACLGALRNQTYPADRMEVVLVDDGSDDDRLARMPATAYPFALRVLRVPHGGLARARNVGIRASRGELLLFVDDDTIADSCLVEEHWKAHQRHPHLIVLGWVNHVADAVTAGRRRRRLADLSTSFFWTANASVRRADLFAVGLFDEDFTEYGWEDLEIGERLRALGAVRRFNRQAIVSHVKSPWRAADLPRLLRQAEASGRSAVLYVRKRPTRRARLATGIGPLRMAANRLVERGEPWYKRRIDRAGEGPLRGIDHLAAYLWTRAAYFRAVRNQVGSGIAFCKRAGSGTVRIVVLRIDKIGDLLVSTPALRSLRNSLPDARITLVTSPGCADVLKGYTAVDDIQVFDPADSRSARARAVERLQRIAPDAIFTFTPKSRIYRLARQIGAPVRVGFGYRSRPLDVAVARLAFTHPVLSDVPEALARAGEVRHHAEELLDLLAAVGLAAERRPMEVPIPEGDREWAGTFLSALGLSAPPILLHLSNKWLDDGWTAADVMSLITSLQRIGDRHVVATVGPSDARISTLIRPLLAQRTGGVSVLENLTFGRWAAIISSSAVVISPDTGAIHVASATHRPVVGVYAVRRFHIFSRQWGPWMVPFRTLPKERGTHGVKMIADAAEDVLRETGAIVASH